MPRPTREDYAQAADDLDELTSRHHPRDDPRHSSGFGDLCHFLRLMRWVDEEARQQQSASAYPAGVEGGVRTLPRGSSHSDIDARTHDPVAKGLRRLEAKWQHEFGQMVDRMQREAEGIVGQQGVRSVG